MSNENRSNEDKIKYGICPVCKVRDNDTSVKKLYKCEYCGEYFCEKHIKPKLVLNRNQIEKIIKDPFLREKLIEEWRNESRHPDKFYTSYFFEKLEESEKRKVEIFNKIINLRKQNNEEETIYKKIAEIEENREKLKSEELLQKNYIKSDEKSDLKRKTYKKPIFKPKKLNKKNILLIIVSLIILLVFIVLIYIDFDKYKLFFSSNTEEVFYFELPLLLRPFRLCPDKYKYKEGKCYYYLKDNPVVRKFSYCWFGEKRELELVLYGGANLYFNKIAEKQVCEGDLEIFYLKSIENEEQIKFIRELIEKIKRIPTSRDNWARIAISLVQNIPYDYDRYYNSGLKCQYETLYFFVINRRASGAIPRYPYNVLYENKGICNEKSRLLALILKELGYGVVLLNFDYENHMAVGIKCPKEYANYIYNNTGYCFIETTKPLIITYNSSDYLGVGKLYSTPKVIFVSDGDSFDSVYMEYSDARRFEELNEIAIRNGNTLPWNLYNEWLEITRKYCIQTS